MLNTLKVIVELGAGTGAFRNRFLPEAFTTDLRAADGIDLLADATKLPFKQESVDEFVANNPYGFGFRSLEKGVEFLFMPERSRIPKNSGCKIACPKSWRLRLRILMQKKIELNRPHRNWDSLLK